MSCEAEYESVVLCFLWITPLLPLRPKQCVPVPLRNWRHCDGGRYPEACFISQQHAPRLWRNEPARGCRFAFMKLLYNITAVFLKTARAQSSAAEPAAAARHLGADMCKELRTKVLRLLPATSNGPSVHSEGHTGQLSHWREHVCLCDVSTRHASFRKNSNRVAGFKTTANVRTVNMTMYCISFLFSLRRVDHAHMLEFWKAKQMF